MGGGPPRPFSMPVMSTPGSRPSMAPQTSPAPDDQQQMSPQAMHLQSILQGPQGGCSRGAPRPPFDPGSAVNGVSAKTGMPSGPPPGGPNEASDSSSSSGKGGDAWGGYNNRDSWNPAPKSGYGSNHWNSGKGTSEPNAESHAPGGGANWYQDRGGEDSGGGGNNDGNYKEESNTGGGGRWSGSYGGGSWRNWSDSN